MVMKKIQNIYAYIETQDPKKLKEEIWTKVSGQNSENGIWKEVPIKDKPEYSVLKHTSEQLEKEGCIALLLENGKLYIYVCKRSDGTKNELDLASLLLGRFITAILYHLPSFNEFIKFIKS
jgi:hypothetical protein